MAWMLFSYYLCHFWRIKEPFVIKEFRSVREHWDDCEDGNGGEGDLESRQYEYVAGKMGMKSTKVREIIEEWIYKRPLKAVYITRDNELLNIIEGMKDRGQKVYVFSDYPIEDKLASLGLLVDGTYAATDPRINELKPSPRGLKLIMEDGDFSPGDILMVGDRMSRDGLSAENAGCDYIILPKSRSGRKKLYSGIFAENMENI
jgi:FMN phosphatase YigB (HAD superfamily)